MKTNIQKLICSCLAAGLTTGSVAQAADAAPGAAKSAAKQPPKTLGAKPAAKAAAAAAEADSEEPTILLNFRGAPLETVLNYLSEAAGFTIILKGTVRGTVDVWNTKPLTKKEAVDVLNLALGNNGYAAIQKGRTLTIMGKDEAMKQNTPVKPGSDPDEIPDNGTIVTQIMPVTHVNAAQLIRDLTPILPTTGTMVANEAGNSIIITDTQANIRHLAEIVKAIDTSISSIAGIKVFALKFADSKAVVTVIKELFAPDASSGGGTSGRGGSPFGGITSRFGGGGGSPFGGGGGGSPFGGAPGIGGAGGRTGGTGGSTRGSSAAKVVAVADDRSNSVVVTAPDDVMPTIEELVNSVDINVDDLTELKVFHLKYSDPTEMATLLAGLFPDDTKTSSSNNSNSRFGSTGGGFSPFGGGGGPGGTPGGTRTAGGSSAATSDRAKKQGRVLAVPDQRTSSLVVTTSHDLMRQIESMVERLDGDPSRKQKVFVYSLENADAQQVQQVLQDLFQSSQTQNRNSRNNQNSALTTRGTQTQNTGGNTSGVGNTGSGLGQAPRGGATGN